MTEQENQAIMTIAVMAAFADGSKHSSERKQLSTIASSLGLDNQVQLLQIDQAVLRQLTQLQDLAAQLNSDGSKMLAYEMAVGVCEADGNISTAEQIFLQQLKDAFGINNPVDIESHASDIGNTQISPQNQDIFHNAVNQVSLAGTTLNQAPTSPSPLKRIDTDLEAAINSRILKASVINGALELLPQTAASMAIIPLQMRLVYSIGQEFGYDLDKGHIKDLLTAMGVGVTSQYLEQAGIKLLGTVLGTLRNSLGGKLGKTLTNVVGKAGNQAISSGMSFASTYALGHVAKEYYAGGRQFSTSVLKDTYARLVQEGVSIQPQYQEQIRQQSKTLDMGKIMQMVKGQ
ncbi:TerB family tellurite resistance protein [Vitreoscilla stercoraria]|uniref:TerB family tellurite resistance protein n=2 Tax=Neisseriaceae TaxID=481 RepID=A0ABY4EIE1_VITST|nr:MULTISPECIES: TerB family tellurite resistance protein [Vitreoscilla]AUZ04045.1 hypothetical protein ADP71_02230 [Vitreoscilla sp. C1]UOO93147.1 TerB family tellurite resistance protein [Vitreoscilla stercoraria]